MNASSWRKLSAGAIKRLATRRSERLELTGDGDRGGYRVATYAIAPRPEIARAGADELVHYLRLAAPSDPGNGQGERVIVSAGGETATRFVLLEVGKVTIATLDATIDAAMHTALALTPFDLTDAYAPLIR